MALSARSSATKTRFNAAAGLPRQAGTYALLLRSGRRAVVPVGKLGELTVQPGWYVYVGRAFGPGGLRARVGRHLRKQKSRHWHLDYLRAVAGPVEVWFTCGEARREHAWAAAVRQMPRAVVPRPRFGASDCRCETHLFFFPTRPPVSVFEDILAAAPGSFGRVRTLTVEACRE